MKVLFMPFDAVDALLNRYETRPEMRKGRERREAAISMAAELNRLQGHKPTDLDLRLRKLRTSGRVDREEMNGIIKDIAQQRNRQLITRG